MTGKQILIVFIIGLFTFLLGWFLHDIKTANSEIPKPTEIESFVNKIPDADTVKIENTNDFSAAISGRFLLKGSNCAGFDFVNKKIVLWTNEIYCNDLDTLKIRWLNNSTFMTRSTERIDEKCPPRVDIYKVTSFDGKRLVLKDIWTGWNDYNDETLVFYKETK
jgi:hypothetical protein